VYNWPGNERITNLAAVVFTSQWGLPRIVANAADVEMRASLLAPAPVFKHMLQANNRGSFNFSPLWVKDS